MTWGKLLFVERTTAYTFPGVVSGERDTKNTFGGGHDESRPRFEGEPRNDPVRPLLE